MNRLNNIKQNLLIVSFAVFLAGCGGGSTTTMSTETDAINMGQVIGQVKDITTGKGLENVEVSIGSHTTTTDIDGFYALSDLTEDKETVVNFEKEGYALGSTKIQVKSLSGDNTISPNYLEYGIHAHDKQWNYDTSDGIADTNINIDASAAYADAEGNPYHGTVSAELTIVDTTTDKGKTLFPGAWKGINTNGETVQFDSYGLIFISLKDSNGNKLSLSDGDTATLRFNAIPSLDKESIIPLWYYNYEVGQWVEEGYAELQADGSYKGEVSHLGTWSLNRPIEDAPGIYRGRIVYAEGTPAQDVRVHAIGNNWSSSDLSTDEDGIFEIEVIPGSSFQLTAYNYKDKYDANYNGTISAIASGEIVEDRI